MSLEKGGAMRVNNHGPAWRRPWWVYYILRRSNSRAEAMLGCSMVVGMAVMFLVAYIRGWEANWVVLGIIFRGQAVWWVFYAIIFLGLWHALAVLWVDRHDHWDDQSPD